MTNRSVLAFAEVDHADIARVGGKGAHLGALARIAGVRVPPGFCVTTDAFARVVASALAYDGLVARLSSVAPDDREAIRVRSAEIRAAIEALVLPDDLAAEITRALASVGPEGTACAVRSSATAEDLPGASFAGQQDTYLNVIGAAAVLEHVRRCWASLFTERAVTYRARNGFDHRTVHMAVVVQQMVFPQAAGILFTADPVTGNRRVSSIDASFGLGEALVSGIVNADVYKVRDLAVSKTIATKELAIRALPGGGTEQQRIAAERQRAPALTDAQAVRLADLGRRIEAQFARPQDIEWCLVDDEFHIVQSRPITTLFPIPAAADDAPHVYVSVGHQQMMTDAMKPLGLSMWKLIAGRPMADAAGRPFVDVTRALASAAGRAGFVQMFAKSDPLMGDALATVVAREFVPVAPDAAPFAFPGAGAAEPLATDANIVRELIANSESATAATRKEMESKAGVAVFEFIRADLQELKRVAFEPRSIRVIVAAQDATAWLNEKLHEWLGEKSAADTLAQSAPNNVTSEMGLALLEVADTIRPHAEIVRFLEGVADGDANFLEQLAREPGGREARDAIEHFLEMYGMRCVGEIDITRPRFRERPTALVPMILANVTNFAAGEAQRRVERGLHEAAAKERDVLARVRALPDGEAKAIEVKANIDRVRTFMGYREYPKYALVSRTFVYRQALWREATKLAQAGVLRDANDICFLTFDEVHEVVRTNAADHDLIRVRKETQRTFESLSPPRVITSEGEALTGSYRRDVPSGALVGLAVSSGTVEGRARVILDVAHADLDAGDILVTPFTDPSWTPVFVAIKGLVTEVGGLMTHGAVIAREYGLPAVVGVENATRVIRDGQRIRVNGTDGIVEILADH